MRLETGARPAIRNVTIIVNPKAGIGLRRLQVARLANLLRARGMGVQICETERAGDGARLARAVSADTWAVVASGGDGTIAEVVCGLLDRQIPVGLLPAGTENLLARELGYRRKDLRQIAAAVDARRTCMVDVCLRNQVPYLIVAGVGFDAEVVHRFGCRRGSRHATYTDWIEPIWRTLMTHRFAVLEVELDGKPVFSGQAQVFVGNVRSFAMDLNPLSRAVVDDGLLDLCILPSRNVIQLAGHLLATMLRVHPRWNRAIYLKGHRVRIHSPAGPVPVETDGDAAGFLPVELSVLPRKCPIIVPSDDGRVGHG